MLIEGLIFFIFVFLVGGFFYAIGKVYYDNDEVRYQFEPLEGVIAYNKWRLKQKQAELEDEGFCRKYKIHPS